MKARGAVRIAWAALLAVSLGGVVAEPVAASGPGVIVAMSGSLAVTTNPQTLTWDTELTDDDGYHSTSVNTGRLTVPAGLGGGQFVVSAWVEYSGGGSVAKVIIYRNGTDLLTYGATGIFISGASATVSLADGDYVTVVIKNTTSGSMVNTDITQRFSLVPVEAGGVAGEPCPTWAPTPTPTPTPSPTPTEGPCTVQVIGFAGTAADTLNLLLVAVVTVGALGLFLLGALAVAAAFRR